MPRTLAGDAIDMEAPDAEPAGRLTTPKWPNSVPA
jgi:hypothetical protein